VLVVHEPTTLSPEGQGVLAQVLESQTGMLRTVTTTSRDLAGLEARGSFSSELMNRLVGVSMAVPPLRARLRELPQIAEAIVAAVAAEHGRPTPLLSADALAALGRHAWPGNVRELKSALTRAVLLGSGRVLTAAHFELDAANQAAGAGAGTLSSAVSEAEHRRILEALRQCSGNQTRAAKMLGISRGTLISRLERYAVPRPRK
jgi:two-component system, NtrC family, response regulator AtoC